MDKLRDYDALTGLLDQLRAAWGLPPATDDLAKAYWTGLKDVALSEVERNVTRLIRTASSDKRFPKPSELRDEVPSESKSDVRFDDAVQRAIRNLEELKRTDEDAWRREVRLRYLDRRIATEWEGSPIYAQARREWLQLRGLA